MELGHCRNLISEYEYLVAILFVHQVSDGITGPPEFVHLVLDNNDALTDIFI